MTIPAGSTSVPITISGAVDDQLVEGPETLIATLTGADNGAAVLAGSDTATRNITDNDTATVTLSGTAAATEGGATGSLTATLTLNTSGTGTPSLQTAITGVTVPSAADYTSSSGSFGVGAVTAPHRR